MEHTMKRRGVIKSIGEDYDDPSMARIEMEEPPTEKEKANHKKHGFGGAPHGRSHTHKMPKDHAAHFAVDDPVELEQTLRHFGRRGEPNKDPRHQVAGGAKKKAEEEA